jgi:hypothetical protein
MRNDGAVIQGCFPHGLPRVAASRPEAVQRHAAPAARIVQPHAHPNAVQLPPHMAPRCALHGGQPLPPNVRQMMESALGARFDDVRIHVGAEAQAIGATSFTHGSHIHFAPGHYDPDTSRGRQLLGRELAHVVQQRAARVQNPFGGGIAIVQDRALEAEADRVVQRIARVVQPSFYVGKSASAALTISTGTVTATGYVESPTKTSSKLTKKSGADGGANSAWVNTCVNNLTWADKAMHRRDAEIKILEDLTSELDSWTTAERVGATLNITASLKPCKLCQKCIHEFCKCYGIAKSITVG